MHLLGNDTLDRSMHFSVETQLAWMGGEEIVPDVQEAKLLMLPPPELDPPLELPPLEDEDPPRKVEIHRFPLSVGSQV